MNQLSWWSKLWMKRWWQNILQLYGVTNLHFIFGFLFFSGLWCLPVNRHFREEKARCWRTSLFWNRRMFCVYGERHIYMSICLLLFWVDWLWIKFCYLWKINCFWNSSEEICFLLQLCPSMERYQQPMVNIMTKRTSPQQIQASSCALTKLSHNGIATTSFTAATTLTCPAGTPQDPSYLTIPFTAPSEEHISEVEPKRPKEQEASMFIACSDVQLIIGMKNSAVLRLMRGGGWLMVGWHAMSLLS